ncbi:MAG: hypothetical protein K2K01_02290 [Eubacterium sp.]|nr:hypothetical protein [Eubacterium sp.]
MSAFNDKRLQKPALKIAVDSNGKFKLSWKKIAGATAYKIYQKQSNGSYKLVKTTSKTSYTTSTAEYGKQCTYKMKAVTKYDSSATSYYSSEVKAKNTKKLQTPTLKAVVNAKGSVTLSWNKITGATSYKLYKKQTNGKYKLLKTTSKTSYTTAALASGKQNTYKMAAIKSKKSSATSAYSKTVTAKNKKLSTPKMKAIANNDQTFTLSWNKVSNATSYQIYRKQSDGTYKLVKTTSNTSYKTGKATYDKQYTYKMKAIRGKSTSALAPSNYSSVVNATCHNYNIPIYSDKEVLVQDAWDETIKKVHHVCGTCGLDFTLGYEEAGYSSDMHYAISHTRDTGHEDGILTEYEYITNT